MARKINRVISCLIAVVLIFGTSINVFAASSYKDWTQWDSRWGSKALGSCGDTMAEIGCAVTSMAILAVHSGSVSESSFNPGTLCDYLSKNGGFDNDGNVYWGAISGLVPSFTYQKKAYFSSKTKSGITSELAGYINQGYYIIMSVKYDGHWLAVDTIKNGEVYMIDPAQNKTDKLFDYYDTDGMLQVRLYKGKNTPAKVTTSGGNSSTTKYLTGHYQTTDYLNLRESYSTSSSVLLTIPSGTTVVVTRVYNDEWGQVEYKNKTGWIYLEYTKYTEGSYTYKTGNYKVNASTGVYMRSGVGSQNSSVCIIPYNATVNVSSVTANWGKVSYNSKTGYVCMEYLDYVGAAVTTAATTKATTTTTKATTTTVKTTASTSKTTAKVTTTTAKTTVSKTTTTVSTTKLTTKATTTTTTTKATTTSKLTTVTTVTTTAKPLIKGDVDRNGKCNKKDLILLNRYLAKPTEDIDFPTSFVMDVNNDKIIDERDAVYLFKLISKGK